MERILIFICLGFCTIDASGQAIAYPNIVPNPSFEDVHLNANGWFYMGEHFSQSIDQWSSPTVASPDIFSPIYKIPPNWTKRGFGKSKAKTGKNYIGITTYGCTNGKPHCREYVQVKLKEKMVPGQRYKVTMWVSHFGNSLAANNLGVYFSENPLWDIGTQTLHLNPQVNEENVIEIPEKKWLYYRQDFIPEVEFQHITIGNFFIDEKTDIIEPNSKHYNFAYYYIDEISIQKIRPYLTADDSELVEKPFELEKAYQLENIYFAFNKTGFLPESYTELNKLLILMREHPQISIQINGHTDDVGKDIYNEQLSYLRAKAVADYLFRHEITRNRVDYKGYGSKMPLAPNINGSRNLNRRVEFIIKSELAKTDSKKPASLNR